MVKSIVIARLHDGLPLVSTIDDDDLERDFPDHKGQLKTLLKMQIPGQTEPRVTVEAGDGGSFAFHCLCRDNLAFIALCDKLYPKKLAYAALDEVANGFIKDHQPLAATINAVTRPYALIRYTNALQRIKRSYADTRARQNIERLQSALTDVTFVMHRSINQLLERGGKLENMNLIASNLSADARKYVRDARQLNWNALVERYGVPAAIGLVIVILLIIYFRYLR